MKRFARNLTGVCLTAALVLAGCGPKATPTQAQTAARSATVSDIVNQVLGRLAADAPWSAISDGFTLESGGGVQTGDNSGAKLSFSDGSIVRVAANASFALTGGGTASDGSPLTTLQLELGKIFVYVAGGTMQVDVAAVRGSWASFAYDPGDPNDPNDDTLTIQCLEGECTAHNENGDLELGTFQGGVLTRTGSGPIVTLTGQDLQDFLNAQKDVAAALQATLTAAAPTATDTPTATATPAATA